MATNKPALRSETGAYQAMAQAHTLVPTTALDEVEAVREYRLGVVGYSVYAALMEAVEQEQETTGTAAAQALASLDPEVRQTRLQALWRAALAKACLMPLVEAHGRFGQPDYQRLLREIIQGAMRAAQEQGRAYREMVRLLFAFLMTIGPHQQQIRQMTYLARLLGYELVLCKLSVGATMKLVSHAIGEGLFLLLMQQMLFVEDEALAGEQIQQVLLAANKGIWQATELVSPRSVVHLRDNSEYLVRGFSESQKHLQRSVVTGTVERVLTAPGIGWVYRPLRWMVRVAYHRLKASPRAQRIWQRLMET